MADEIFKMVPEQMDKIILENKEKKIERDHIYDDDITQLVDKTIKSLSHQIAHSRLTQPKKRWIKINLEEHISTKWKAMDIVERIRAVGFEARYRPNEELYIKGYYIEIRDRDVPDSNCTIL
uniref:Uncharacterized protein n=1 Tax=Marseillevirus LCMAC202 TaxID=2506606 RepID=A0A481YYJ8_9VIRU|nr:MAG: hypothetical protein LCMAC202_02660 [Marseillevirus LCMAC202]